MNKTILCIVLLINIAIFGSHGVLTGNEADDYQIQMTDSWESWNALKEQHDNTYYYVREYSAEEAGYTTKTTVWIESGQPVKRRFEMSRWEYDSQLDIWQNKITEQWVEEGQAIGSHCRGFSAHTMDALYEECANQILEQEPQDNWITFSVDEDGLMNICTYFPKDCMDDCEEGIRLIEFVFTD